MVGSINMDYRSLFLHFECGVLLQHNSQVAALRDDVRATLPQCREIHISDCRTSIPGIFASGDAVKGARTVVEAVAYSKTVAEAMHEYMQTLPPDLPDEYANVPVAEYDEGN